MVTFALVALSGCISALPLFMPWLWPLAFIGVVPFLHAITSPLDRNRLLLIGWLFGCVYTGTAWAPVLFAAIPLETLWLSPLASAFVLSLFWLMISVTTGSLFAFFAFLFSRLRTSSATDTMLAASLWVLVQYGQMYLFALLFLGKGVIFGPHISSLFVGYALASFPPFLQLAGLGGVYLLTFAAIVCAESIRQALFPGSRTPLFTCLCIIAALIIAPVFSVAGRAPSLRAALITTWNGNILPFTASARQDRARAAGVLIKNWASTAEAPDLLVFPEGLFFFAASGEDPTTFSERLFATSSVAIIDNGDLPETKIPFKRMHFYDDGMPVGIYEKRLLAPGEYVPSLAQPFGWVLSRLYVSGSDATIPTLGGTRIGALFCFELLSPSLYRDASASGAEIFVNAASYVWFHRSPLVENYMLSIAKVRAAESGRYLLLAGDEIPSMVISDKGVLLARSEHGVPGVLSADVPRLTAKTPYVRLGDWLLFLPLIFVAQSVLRKRLSRRAE